MKVLEGFSRQNHGLVGMARLLMLQEASVFGDHEGIVLRDPKMGKPHNMNHVIGLVGSLLHMTTPQRRVGFPAPLACSTNLSHSAIKNAKSGRKTNPSHVRYYRVPASWTQFNTQPPYYSCTKDYQCNADICPTYRNIDICQTHVVDRQCQTDTSLSPINCTRLDFSTKLQEQLLYELYRMPHKNYSCAFTSQRLNSLWIHHGYTLDCSYWILPCSRSPKNTTKIQPIRQHGASMKYWNHRLSAIVM